MNIAINEDAQKVAAGIDICETVPQAVLDLSVPCDVTLLLVRGPEIG